MNDQELQALNEKGKRNLQEGMLLASEKFMQEMERTANDETLPSMPPGAVEQMMIKIHKIMEKHRQNTN